MLRGMPLLREGLGGKMAEMVGQWTGDSAAAGSPPPGHIVPHHHFDASSTLES